MTVKKNAVYVLCETGHRQIGAAHLWRENRDRISKLVAIETILKWEAL